MIAIIDYGIGNLGSVKNAFNFLGFEVKITSDYEEILKADKVVLPGVGAFADGINTFKAKGFDKILKQCVEMKKPILGICLGMQMLFERSFEYGVHEGLGLLKGDIVKFKDQVDGKNYKVPHIGWNSLDVKTNNPLFSEMNNEYVYFVHSYYVTNNLETDTACKTNYAGVDFTSAVCHDNIYATQFHPEKSGEVGLKFLKRFGEL